MHCIASSLLDFGFLFELGKVDFEVLRQYLGFLLGERVEESISRYEFTLHWWPFLTEFLYGGTYWFVIISDEARDEIEDVDLNSFLLGFLSLFNIVVVDFDETVLVWI
jgi:hypothetical protein